MLFLVRMDITLPDHLTEQESMDMLSVERQRCQELQSEGKWLHLWRVVGKFANYSVFDVASNDELHELLSGLPIFPFAAMEVMPLAAHPVSMSMSH